MKFFKEVRLRVVAGVSESRALQESGVNPAPVDLFPRGWSWLGLVGPDTKDFLHRLSTADVKSLEIGRGIPGCFLTPQGKVRASFQIWRDAAESYSFEFDPGQTQTPQGENAKQQILAFIDQYTFSEKMTVVDRDRDWEWMWLFPELESELARMGAASAVEGDTFLVPSVDSGVQLRVCFHQNFELGRHQMTVWGPHGSVGRWFAATFPEAMELAASELELWRIQQMTPRVDFEITADTSPLEVGLVQSIADQKGCYPGQEVIERILSMGSPPRRLVRIEIQGHAPRPGDGVVSHDAQLEVGKVTSVVSEAHPKVAATVHALALVKKTFAKIGETVRFSSCPETTGVIMQTAPHENKRNDQ